MSPVKEPAFFADPEELASDSRIAAEHGYAQNRERYLSLFADARNERYVGESSTHYTKWPRITGVAAQMAEFAPDAKILYLVRDPVERTLSHYRYAVRMKYERRPILEAVRNDPIYCAVSDYARQIRPFLDAFGPASVHIAVLEELSKAESTTDLYAWLGVEPPAPRPVPMRQRNQVGDEVSRARGPDVLHRIGRTSTYQRVARSVVPSGLRSAVREALNRPVAAESVRHPEVLAWLRETLDPHAVALEHLIGREMAAWTTLRPQP